MLGGLTPDCPAAAKVSEQVPAVAVLVANPEKVWKSSLNVQILSETLLSAGVNSESVLFSLFHENSFIFDNSLHNDFINNNK